MGKKLFSERGEAKENDSSAAAGQPALGFGGSGSSIRGGRKRGDFALNPALPFQRADDLGDVGRRAVKLPGEEAHVQRSAAAKQDEKAKAAIGEFEELERAAHPVVEAIGGFQKIQVNSEGQESFLAMRWSSGHRCTIRTTSSLSG